MIKKTAVITGAGSGIGLAIARAFAAQGATVAALDIDLTAAEAAADGIRQEGGQARAMACDISDAASVKAAFASAAAQLGSVDILVNNAGIADVGNLLATDEARFEKVMAVNVKGQFLCAQEAVRAMLAQGGGVILNMSSIAALIGVKDRLAYSTSKGAVLAMTKSIAIDYLDAKIRCNCICPARVHTPFVDGFLAKNYPGKEAEKFKELSAYQPMGRMATPEEVAAMALYLCSDEAAFVTGQAFPLDGGVLLV